MSLIVIEGLDGSGKSTQVNLMKQFLTDKGINHQFVHFPKMEVGVYGKLIARFLRGEMGALEQVDPYLVALLFAGDRNDSKEIMENWLQDGAVVILDRYVYSNIAFQCAKLNDPDNQKQLADWIIDLEYGYHQLPKPAANIFLDVPFDFIRGKLTGERDGDDRDYLQGKRDIHEEDLQFQENVRHIYHTLCKQAGNLEILNCADEQGAMRTPTSIFSELLSITGFRE